MKHIQQILITKYIKKINIKTKIITNRIFNKKYNKIQIETQNDKYKTINSKIIIKMKYKKMSSKIIIKMKYKRIQSKIKKGKITKNKKFQIKII